MLIWLIHYVSIIVDESGCQVEGVEGSPSHELAEGDGSAVVRVDLLESILGVLNLDAPAAEFGDGSGELGKADLVVGVAVDPVEGHPILKVLVQEEQQSMELILSDDSIVGFVSSSLLPSTIKSNAQCNLSLSKLRKSSTFSESLAKLNESELSVAIGIQLLPKFVPLLGILWGVANGETSLDLLDNFGSDGH
jgi:hypothetical protein